MTWALIGINSLMFLYSSFLSEQSLYRLFNLFGLVPARYTSSEWAQWAGLAPTDYTPFVTSMFLHGSGMHLIMNMWLLWIFGDNIEDRMGSVRFLSFYLSCGLVAGVLQVYFSRGSIVPTIGASGAIAGIMGAYFFLYPYARIVIWVLFLPLFVAVPAIGFLGFWVIIQLHKATTGLAIGAAYSDVAWWGHLGGFIAGMLTYRVFLWRERDPEGAA
jgi:membrane associated rhomboid family serine protease